MILSFDVAKVGCDFATEEKFFRNYALSQADRPSKAL